MERIRMGTKGLFSARYATLNISTPLFGPVPPFSFILKSNELPFGPFLLFLLFFGILFHYRKHLMLNQAST